MKLMTVTHLELPMLSTPQAHNEVQTVVDGLGLAIANEEEEVMLLDDDEELIVDGSDDEFELINWA
jgi:hypothetical protein